MNALHGKFTYYLLINVKKAQKKSWVLSENG